MDFSCDPAESAVTEGHRDGELRTEPSTRMLCQVSAAASAPLLLLSAASPIASEREREREGGREVGGNVWVLLMPPTTFERRFSSKKQKVSRGIENTAGGISSF